MPASHKIPYKSVPQNENTSKTASSTAGHALIAPKNNLLLPSVLLVLACLLIINSVYVVERMAASRNQVTHSLTSTQQAVTPSLSAHISNVGENSTPDPAFTLADGETMLILNLSLTNRTGTAQSFIPTNQLYVRTPDGDYRPLHPSIFATRGLASGQIAPGQTISGQVSFGVPAHVSDLLLYIDTTWNHETPVVYRVLQ